MNHPDEHDHIDDGKTGCLVPGCLMVILAAVLLMAGMVLR